MNVNSYFELSTTLIGWYIASGISQTLVNSGLIFIPFGVALYRNSIEPIRSQEAKSATPVSLRRMEQDVLLATIVIVFFFLPAVPIDPSEIKFNDTKIDKTTSAGDLNVPYLQQSLTKTELIKVPVVWWFAYRVSSLITEETIGYVDNLGQPSTLRPSLMRISKVSLTNEQLRKEIRVFRRDCYEPSLAKYQISSNPPQAKNLYEDVDWIGSKLFSNTPGYYKRCSQVKVCGSGYHASFSLPDWQSVTDEEMYDRGMPYCDIWWKHETLGLRSKIIADLHKQWDWFADDLEQIRRANNTGKIPVSTVENYEDKFLRRLLNQAPRVMADKADRSEKIEFFSLGVFSIDGLQQVIGSAFALLVSAIFHIIMELVLIGLPMIQALVLMILYISIPLVVPYAVIRPSIIIKMILVLFSVRFLSALWAICAFLDESLLSTMYPDATILEFGGTGSTQDVVLGLITLFSYIFLPLSWFLLVSSIGTRAVGSLSSSWAQLNQSLQAANSPVVKLGMTRLQK